MFTVVIPLYNKKSCIDRAISSALNQALLPSEIIVIDDGSTDGGGEIVTSRQNKLITYIKQKNYGASHARNTGMSLAKTDYIAFLDADDEWNPEHLATLKDLIIKYPEASIYASGYKLAYPAGHTKNANIVFNRNFSEGIVDNFYEISSRGNCVLSATTAAIKKSTIDTTGGFPVGIHLREDIYFWVNLIGNFKLAATKKITATYHKQAENSACEHRQPRDTDQAFLKLITENINTGKIPPHEVPFSIIFSNRYTRMNAMKSYLLGSKETAKKIIKQHKNITTVELIHYLIIVAIIYAPNLIVKNFINIKRKISNEN